MEFDLGITGFALLLVMSLGFGLIAQAIAWITGSRWMWLWLIGAVAYFVSAALASEWVFAWATVDDLQPMIDGLLFDEALLGGLVLGVPVTIGARFLTRPSAARPPRMAS